MAHLSRNGFLGRWLTRLCSFALIALVSVSCAGGGSDGTGGRRYDVVLLTQTGFAIQGATITLLPTGETLASDEGGTAEFFDPSAPFGEPGTVAVAEFSVTGSSIVNDPLVQVFFDASADEVEVAFVVNVAGKVTPYVLSEGVDGSEIVGGTSG
ncbi:MAG: hypothetical protein KDD44_10975, partial [Bdellovibrionales bacterium]|nr:hypothetical protein [Bdellovibrionales bacterium]